MKRRLPASVTTELFNCPAATVDGFADQIESVVTAALDDLAPLRRRQSTSPVGFHMTLWKPSAIAVDSNVDGYERATQKRVSYRRACRSANTTISEARRSYFSDQLIKAANGTERWRTVKTLLHSDQNNTVLSNAESDTLCNSFSQFFIDKISDLKQAVAGDPYFNNIPIS